MFSKRALVLSAISSIVIATFVIGPIGLFAQGVNIESKTIEYNLAYPGILPDNPVYVLKSARDNLLLFLTRDYVKKADLLLKLSDKKANGAILLSKKGKWQMSSKLLLEAEEDFDKIPAVLELSKSQGVSSTESFILTLKLSNEKHYQVIESLLKETTQGERATYESALKLNRQIRDKKLKKL